MAIVQSNLGSHVITYDNETNQILSFDATEEHKKRKAEATIGVLGKKEEFKKRGSIVVKPEFIENWIRLVDNSLVDMDTVWYNGVSIEAALKCMEGLSAGLPVEDVYKHIDVQNPDVPSIHLGMELSGWQNHSVTSVVGSYHERGIEFCKYRDEFVNRTPEKKPGMKM